MRLSEYCDENENRWINVERKNADKLITYLNGKVDVNLYEVAKTDDNLEVYNRLKVWLLNYYKEDLMEGLKNTGIPYEDFQRRLIYSLALSVTRNSPNIDVLIHTFKKNNIIKDVVIDDEGNYKILTENFGDISFSKADKYFEDDKETLDYINNYGANLKSGCHDISFYLMKKYKGYKAVTSICDSSLDKKYYHSFIVNGDEVIDGTSNMVMKKDDYYKLNNVKELSVLDYSEYLNKKDESVVYDESKTLFELLRIGAYNQYNESHKKEIDLDERN